MKTKTMKMVKSLNAAQLAKVGGGIQLSDLLVSSVVAKRPVASFCDDMSIAE